MDLTNFHQDLQKYTEIHGYSEHAFNLMIEVGNLIEEIKQDHLQGNADDADRQDEE